MSKPHLEFGLNSALPDGLTTAWGARFIFPDDMLADRQCLPGVETPQGLRLMNWLNGGALTTARAEARVLARRLKITQGSATQVTLWEDEIGIIVANPNASYGYLYVAAWLKEEAR